MLSITQTLTLLLSLTLTPLLTTASPIDVPTTPSAVITRAKILGIDLAGPIPDDYTSYDATTKRYSFDAGSKASAWASAQVAALEFADVSSFSKRSNSSVGIGMWQGPWCSGTGWYVNEIQYNVAYVSVSPMNSVGVSRRSLVPSEQLDFSRLNTANMDYCGIYAYTASRTTPPGCWNSQPLNCLRLWIN